MKYDDFVASKRRMFQSEGLDVSRSRLESFGLFDFQADLTLWALKKGRACIFADTGLGKTAMQLVWAHVVPGRVIVLAPLSVAQQTEREARRLGIDGATYLRSDDGKSPIVLTNYERMHRFNLESFDGVVLDESSILKNFAGKLRTRIINEFSRTKYRLACSATPAPNDYMELGNHSEFVGAMTRAEMLATYFVHDGGEVQKWRLKGHASSDFWEWVSGWAAFVRTPSDLGRDGSMYALPPMHEHVIGVPVPDDSSRTGLFWGSPSLRESRQIARATLSDRCAAAAKIVSEHPRDSWLIWCNLNDESSTIAGMIDGAVEVTGSDSVEHKERSVSAFADGEIRVLVSKPSICGFGMNFQTCHRMIFVGLNYSWESRYQAIRRCWRFGQESEVHVYSVMSDADQGVYASLSSKQDQFSTMYREVISATRRSVMGDDIHAKEDPVLGSESDGDQWTIINGDCVTALADVESDSIGLSVFSPPFASLYTYTDSLYDMGNCSDGAEFIGQFEFLAKELHRVLMPGRHVAVHCMNLPTSKARDGVIGIRDFRGEIIRLFESVGFVMHSEVCIWKDPVTAMQRTKALGLLWKQLKKDSSMSRQGIPDYVVAMRKVGDNPEPVAHTPEEFPVDLWQKWASPVWHDIVASETLQKSSAREEDDERHIAPLQLEVIRRCVGLWSNPGDLVLSPFAGIGSEGYQSVLMGRRFLGIELKRSYYKQAVENLRAASLQSKQLALFA